MQRAGNFHGKFRMKEGKRTGTQVAFPLGLLGNLARAESQLVNNQRKNGMRDESGER